MGISYKFTNNLIVLVHSQYTHKLSFTINKAVTELSHTRHLRDRAASCATFSDTTSNVCFATFHPDLGLCLTEP